MQPKIRLSLERLESRSLLATFVVSELGDDVVGASGDAPGTFRQAIFDANTLPGADTITFAPDVEGTLILRDSDIRISDSVDIQGPGGDRLWIRFQFSRPTSFRIEGESTDVSIDGLAFGASASGECASCDDFDPYLFRLSNRSLALSNARLTGASVGIDTDTTNVTIRRSRLDGFYIAIRVDDDAVLLIEDSVISDNLQALDIHGVSAIIRRATISNNQYRFGAGMHCASCNLTIEHSTISHNTATYGAGIFSTGNVTIRDSTIRDNVSTWGQDETPRTIGGAGIYSDGGLFIQSSLIANNHADKRGLGGGLHLLGQTVIHNSTISGNTALYRGAGIYANASNLSLINTTVVGNNTSGLSPNAGGGIQQRDGSLYILNSIVADNDQRAVREPAARDIKLLGNPELTIRASLIGTVTGTMLAESLTLDEFGNLLGGEVDGRLDPMLGPLTYNGGPTLTHAVLPGSPAVDAGVVAHILTPFDQRGEGFRRMFNGIPDMGAYELQSIVGDFDGDYAVGCREVNELAEAIFGEGEPDAIYDLTEDGSVNGEDMDALLTSIATHRLHTRKTLIAGDANLDGAVDVSDFNIWLANRNTTSRGSCQGDFNVDGIVDEVDHEIWTENRFNSIFEDKEQPAEAVEAAAISFDQRGLPNRRNQKIRRSRLGFDERRHQKAVNTKELKEWQQSVDPIVNAQVWHHLEVPRVSCQQQRVFRNGDRSDLEIHCSCPDLLFSKGQEANGRIVIEG